MNIKSFKYIAILLLLLTGVTIITECSKQQKQIKEETIQYRKVEVGDVDFTVIDEYGNENKYVRQWIIDNKEEEGFYTKVFEGNTYIMYSMGEKDSYGYSVSPISLVKEEENKPIILYLTTSKPDLSIAIKETNYPYIALKIEGNIKDEFKEKVLTEESDSTKKQEKQEKQNKKDESKNKTKGDENENK